MGRVVTSSHFYVEEAGRASASTEKESDTSVRRKRQGVFQTLKLDDKIFQGKEMVAGTLLELKKILRTAQR